MALNAQPLWDWITERHRIYLKKAAGEAPPWTRDGIMQTYRFCNVFRELDIVTQAETLDHFRTVREDLDSLARATAMLEAVDQVAQEREANPRLYQMLLGALHALGASGGSLVVPGFFWKLLSLEGSHPVLDQCASCGSRGELVAFDLGEGGALCRPCRRGVPISPSALSLVRKILGGQLAEALREPEGPTTAEVSELASRSLEHHLERRLRSLTVLDRS